MKQIKVIKIPRTAHKAQELLHPLLSQDSGKGLNHNPLRVWKYPNRNVQCTNHLFTQLTSPTYSTNCRHPIPNSQASPSPTVTSAHPPFIEEVSHGPHLAPVRRGGRPSDYRKHYSSISEISQTQLCCARILRIHGSFAPLH